MTGTQDRSRLAIGVRAMAFPAVPVSPVLDCLRRLPQRRDAQRIGEVAGRLLWLLRLGVTVLAHEPAGEGWVCTLVGTDRPPGRLPVGVFVVSDLEIATAMSTDCPWQPVAALTGEEYRDAWRVRLAAAGRGRMLGEALLAHAEPESLVVDITDPRMRSGSGCRTVAGFRLACGRLRDTGLLTAVGDTTDWSAGSAGEQINDHHRIDSGASRYALSLPPSTWPAP